MTHFSKLGMFTHWVQEFGADKIYSLLSYLATQNKCKIILTGCEWDKPFSDQIFAKDTSGQFVDMVAKTDIDQFFGLLRNANAMVGWCGGNTIMSTVFKIPTLMFWNRYFPAPGFYTNCCPPDSLNKWYFPVRTDTFSTSDMLKFSKIVS